MKKYTLLHSAGDGYYWGLPSEGAFRWVLISKEEYDQHYVEPSTWSGSYDD